MTTVKFDKSVKYNGIRYSAHEVFKVDDKDVAQLKKAGAIIVSSTPEPAPQKPEPKPEDTKGEDVAKLKEKLLSYTVPELTQFAKERDIDLKGKTHKADIYNLIVAELD